MNALILISISYDTFNKVYEGGSIVLFREKFDYEGMDNSVQINNLEFKYPGSEIKIFTDLNLNVEQGEFCCLLGQSGCGKSTLLRLIAGLELPTSGEIKFGGISHRGPGLEKGVVFQDYGLYPWMTIGSNIELAIEQRFPEISKSEKAELAKKWISNVGLKKEVYGMLPKELSGGMRQRVAIARTFAIDSPIMLMDEPFGALDAVTRANLQEMLIDLWRDATPKKTVFFVTHDVDEALILAERVFIVGQGSNDIVYETRVEENERIIRGQENSHEAIELRNKLVDKINEDVESKIIGG